MEWFTRCIRCSFDCLEKGFSNNEPTIYWILKILKEDLKECFHHYSEDKLNFNCK